VSKFFAPAYLSTRLILWIRALRQRLGFRYTIATSFRKALRLRHLTIAILTLPLLIALSGRSAAAADKVPIWLDPRSMYLPESGGKHLITGLSILDRDDPDRAAAQFQHCKNFSLVSSPVLCRMSTAFLDAEMYDRSIECADIIIKRGKKLSSTDEIVRAYTAKAHDLIVLKKRAEAAACLVQACHVEEGYKGAPYNEASEELLKLGKTAEALKIADEGIKTVPELPFAYLARALALNSTKRHQEALDTLTKCLVMCDLAKKKYGPDCYIGFVPKVYQERAICYEKLGQPARAEADRKYVRSENNAWDDTFFAERNEKDPKAAKAKTSKK